MAAKNRKSGRRSGSGSQSNKKRQAALKVTRRIVNSKRHTIGYVVGDKSYSLENTPQRNNLLSMARNGRITGVRVVGDHLQAIPGRRKLSTLPQTISR